MHGKKLCYLIIFGVKHSNYECFCRYKANVVTPLLKEEDKVSKEYFGYCIYPKYLDS